MTGLFHIRTALVGIGADIGPKLVELLVGENAAPGRHLPLAVGDGFIEACPLVSAEFFQVESIPRIDQVFAVTGGAILGVNLLTGTDQSVVLRARGRRGGK